MRLYPCSYYFVCPYAVVVIRCLILYNWGKPEQAQHVVLSLSWTIYIIHVGCTELCIVFACDQPLPHNQAHPPQCLAAFASCIYLMFRNYSFNFGRNVTKRGRNMERRRECNIAKPKFELKSFRPSSCVFYDRAISKR